MQKISYSDAARAQLLAGAQLVYDAVRVTAGPKGHNVVISWPGGETVTHDGVTVARSVNVNRDPEAPGLAAGANLLRSAAIKTNDTVGDGTTTATILAYALLAEAHRLIGVGTNAMDLKRSLEAASAKVLAQLPELVTTIAGSPEQIRHVATVSAGEAAIGDLIADIVAQIGEDGAITVEAAPVPDLEVEVTEGFVFDRGLVSPYLVTDAARMTASYSNVPILLVASRLSSFTQLLPFLEKFLATGGKELVIVADEIDGDALGGLIQNHLKDRFHVLAVRTPGLGERRLDVLEDLAILTGATVVSDTTGTSLATAEPPLVLGRARRVIASLSATTVVAGAGEAAEVKARLAQLASLIAAAPNDYERGEAENRRAALVGKVAVIKVGGAVEAEVEERKYRVDDAVAATKAALSGGIVAGGGTSLLQLAEALSDDDLGERLLKQALEQPFKQLMENAGLDASEKRFMVSNAKPGYGYDVRQPFKLVDLVKTGIIDPAKVTAEAITNAVAVAGVAMTMGALIAELPDDTVKS